MALMGLWAGTVIFVPSFRRNVTWLVPGCRHSMSCLSAMACNVSIRVCGSGFLEIVSGPFRVFFVDQRWIDFIGGHDFSPLSGLLCGS
jgi:hypothetical protein